MTIEYGWFLEASAAETLALDSIVSAQTGSAGWVVESNTYGKSNTARYRYLSDSRGPFYNFRLGGGYNYSRYTSSDTFQLTLFDQQTDVIQDMRHVMTDVAGTPTLEFYRDDSLVGSVAGTSFDRQTIERLKAGDAMGFSVMRVYDTDGATLLHEWQCNLVRNAADDGFITRQAANDNPSLAQPNFASTIYDTVANNNATIADGGSVFVYNNPVTAGDTFTTDTTGNAFSVSGLGTVSDVFLSDGTTNYSLPFTETGGSGTFNIPALSDISGHCLFTDATASIAVTLDVTDGLATASKGVTFNPQGNYLAVTMLDADLAVTAGDPARIDAGWTTKLVEPEQVVLDSTIATIDSGALLTIVTTDPTFTSTAYAIDDTGMEAFTVSDSGTTPPDDGIPVDQRTPPWKLALYITAQEGIEGAVNDVLYEWLGSLGYTGSLNDRWIQYWEALGYEGSYNDLREQWLKTSP